MKRAGLPMSAVGLLPGDLLVTSALPHPHQLSTSHHQVGTTLQCFHTTLERSGLAASDPLTYPTAHLLYTTIQVRHQFSENTETFLVTSGNKAMSPGISGASVFSRPLSSCSTAYPALTQALTLSARALCLSFFQCFLFS